MDDNGIMIHEDHNSKLYKLDTNKLYFIEHWKHNRPRDIDKVREIGKSILNKTFIEKPLIVVKQIKTYVCIDGGHRLEAYRNLEDKITITCKVFNKTCDDMESHKLFIECNKDTPVPYVYFQPVEFSNMCCIIETSVRNIISKYPGNLSKAEKNAAAEGKFKKNELINDLYNLYVEHKIPHNRVHFENFIEEYNDSQLQRVKNNRSIYRSKPETIDAYIKEKCVMFLDGDWQLKFANFVKSRIEHTQNRSENVF